MNALAAVDLAALDWGIIAAFFVVSLGIGLWASRSAGKDSKEFFLGGRSMPWWLLGVSMVATTFSTDTPNLVAGLVRADGVAGNWGWWGFLLSGMLTVFVFAKLWRRSEVMTDVEFYELRFSGKSAGFLRGFRSLYLGLVFNVLIMGSVSLAVVKFGEIVLGVPGWQTLLVAGIVTLAYSSLGGLKGVIWTDFVQFILAMIGSIWAVLFILDLEAVGGVQAILDSTLVGDKASIFPDFSDPSSWIPLILVPLAITWWATYYPGAEPGGGGYIVQRMLSAKDEKNAVGATFLFNVAHYALRPWPWILIALASIIMVPMKIDRDYEKGHLRPNETTVERINKELAADSYDGMKANLVADIAKLEDGAAKDDAQRLLTLVDENPDAIEIKTLAYLWQNDKEASPIGKESLVHMYLVNDVSLDKLGQDLGYPTMLTLLPSGLIGLVSASLIAAFMSTMSTQVNLGASYLVNDFYARFIKPEASPKELVHIGRLATVIMLMMGSVLGLILTDAGQAFKLLLLIGAGTGPVYILRWFWWRVSAISEIAAMVGALVVSSFVTWGLPEIIGSDSIKAFEWQIMLIGALATTVIWIIVTLATPPTDKTVLIDFFAKVQPGGPGWKQIAKDAKAAGKDLSLSEGGWDVPTGILCTLFGSAAVYTALFSTGYFIYGQTTNGIINLVICVVCFGLVMNLFKKLKMS
jgi:Na+/proline symporter